jgi:hypothetical protein
VSAATLPRLKPLPNGVITVDAPRCRHPVAVILQGPKVGLTPKQRAALSRLLQQAPRLIAALHRVAESVSIEGEVLDAGQLCAARVEVESLLALVGLGLEQEAPCGS